MPNQAKMTERHTTHPHSRTSTARAGAPSDAKPPGAWLCLQRDAAALGACRKFSGRRLLRQGPCHQFSRRLRAPLGAWLQGYVALVHRGETNPSGDNMHVATSALRGVALYVCHGPMLDTAHCAGDGGRQSRHETPAAQEEGSNKNAQPATHSGTYAGRRDRAPPHQCRSHGLGGRVPRTQSFRFTRFRM